MFGSTRLSLGHARVGEKVGQKISWKVWNRARCYTSNDMSAITLQLPDDLAGLLSKYQDRLPEILEEGIRTREYGGAPSVRKIRGFGEDL